MQDPATKPACSDSSRLLFATDAALVCRRGAAVAGLGLSGVGGPEVKARFERQAEAERARARQEQGKRMCADST